MDKLKYKLLLQPQFSSELPGVIVIFRVANNDDEIITFLYKGDKGSPTTIRDPEDFDCETLTAGGCCCENCNDCLALYQQLYKLIPEDVRAMLEL